MRQKFNVCYHLLSNNVMMLKYLRLLRIEDHEDIEFIQGPELSQSKG